MLSFVRPSQSATWVTDTLTVTLIKLVAGFSQVKSSFGVPFYVDFIYFVHIQRHFLFSSQTQLFQTLVEQYDV